MFKRILLLAALCAFFVGTTGCLTTNWAHNRRHFKKWREEIRMVHVEIDRVFFDLEPDPSEW